MILHTDSKGSNQTASMRIKVKVDLSLHQADIPSSTFRFTSLKYQLSFVPKRKIFWGF